jgi:hypothetical protein
MPVARSSVAMPMEVPRVESAARVGHLARLREETGDRLHPKGCATPGASRGLR